jgi:dihydroneopterin aldolase
VKVELRGLQLFGYHGVEDEEQRLGQLFLYDVELEVGDRGADDRIEEAVDYTLVAEAVREVNDRRHNLLEALATAVADTLAERFSPESVVVRVRKPYVRPAGLEVEYSAVTVSRP